MPERDTALHGFNRVVRLPVNNEQLMSIPCS
jgi:hypothetical protein